MRVRVVFSAVPPTAGVLRRTQISQLPQYPGWLREPPKFIPHIGAEIAPGGMWNEISGRSGEAVFKAGGESVSVTYEMMNQVQPPQTITITVIAVSNQQGNLINPRVHWVSTAPLSIHWPVNWMGNNNVDVLINFVNPNH